MHAVLLFGLGFLTLYCVLRQVSKGDKKPALADVSGEHFHAKSFRDVLGREDFMGGADQIVASFRVDLAMFHGHCLMRNWAK